MVNFSIAYDNGCVNLGKYFDDSKTDLVNYLVDKIGTAVIKEISTEDCTPQFIEEHLPSINQSNFCFVAYSHGKGDQLTANNIFYIESIKNSYLFGKSLFYSMACYTGLDLGKALVHHGSHCFIGYNNLAYVLPGTYGQMCIDCDNYAIKRFIDGATLSDAYEEMKKYFSSCIDKLEEDGEPILASELRRNRDALVLHGNGEISINDFRLN